MAAPALNLVTTPSDPIWAQAAGSPLGWLAFFATAGCWIRSSTPRSGRGLKELLLCGFFILLACTVARSAADATFGYRALLLLACTTAVIAAGRARPLLRGGLSPLGFAALSGLPLACVALWRGDAAWSGAAVALLTVASAVAAWQWSSEAWLSWVGIGLSVSAGLGSWDACREGTVTEVRLVHAMQGMAIAASVFALAWPALAGRLRSAKASGSRGLCSWQLVPAAIAFLANAVIFIPLCVRLWRGPMYGDTPLLAAAGSVTGWTAFIMALCAALRLTADPGRTPPVLRGLIAFGLGGGCLAAATASSSGWPLPHLSIGLMSWMVTLALALLVIALRRSKGVRAEDLLSRTEQGWTWCLGVAILWGAGRVAGPAPAGWIAVGAILTLSLAALSLARWRQRRDHARLGGILLAVAVLSSWALRGPVPPEAYVWLPSGGLLAGSILWAAVRDRKTRQSAVVGRVPAARHAA